MTIGSDGKVVVPCTPDRCIWITHGDGGGGVIADDRIGSTDPDTGRGVYPDDDGCIDAGT